MKNLLLSLLFSAAIAVAAPLAPDAYTFTYSGVQESNGLHAAASGAIYLNVTPGQTVFGLADLTGFNMTLFEQTLLFQFTETTFQRGLGDVTSFSLDTTLGTLDMVVKLTTVKDTNLFDNFTTFGNLDNLGQVATVGLAVGPLFLTASPEPASYAEIIMGLILVGVCFVLKQRRMERVKR